ncbi:MAG: inorganic phosphate transporter [Candidatus Omnitrophica bacterium]|nr:inorganic phosphate transporter [Candidatus Omnitrophota bacterium]
MDFSVGLIFALGLVLAAEFVNGWTDAPNSIATVVSTRVLAPFYALAMATFFNILGAMSGTAVASTIGKGIVETSVIDLTTVGAAMIAIVCWSTFTYYWGGLPTSESHALVAGLSGAALATAGPSALLWVGWKKVFLGLLFSTFLGFGGGLIVMTAVYRIFAKASPAFIRRLFGKAQLLSSALMAFSHGSNDGQKFIGVFCLVLLLGGVHQTFHVPLWVILLCAAVMGVGTSIGGWKIIKTMGLKLTKLEPVHGFAAETGAGATIALASHLGIPLSTTHTINTAIMGVGATRRFSAVRWGVTRNIVVAWLLTFPVCGAIAFCVAKAARLLLGGSG